MDDNCFRTQRCAILSRPALEPRVFAWWKCDHAVQLCTSCICGCTIHASRRLSGGFSSGNRNWSELWEKSQFVRPWRMLRIPIARLPVGLIRFRRRWRSCRQVSPRLFVEHPSCFRVNCVVEFFDSFELLPFSLSYLLTAKDGSCQVFVMPSFALSFRLSKVGSLIEWLLRSFCIYCENPMLRILNSFSSCSDADVLLQGASVVQHCVFLSTRCHTTNFCTIHWRTIVKVSLDGVRAFADGPCLASVSPGSTFFYVQKVRAWLHDCCSSWQHSQGLRWRHGCSGRTPLVSAKTSYFFHSCNWWSRFPSRYCTQDIAVWRNFRKVRRSLCCSCQRVNPVILCWTCWSSASGSSHEGRILRSGRSRTSQSTSWPCSHVLCSAARLQKEGLQKFCNPKCCCWVSVTLRIAWWVPRWSSFLALWIMWTVLRVRFEDNSWHSWSQANLMVELVLSFHTYRFLNANRGQCVVENDCMWLCLGKLQTSLLSKLQIAAIYNILIAFPRILEWNNSWFCYC